MRTEQSTRSAAFSAAAVDEAPPPPERHRSFLHYALKPRFKTHHWEGSAVEWCFGLPVTLRRRPYFTYSVMVINCTMMIVEFHANGWQLEPLGRNWSVGVAPATLVRLGAKQSALILQGEWWRLLAASWLHAGVVHLLLNVGQLWLIGAPLERAYGWYRVGPCYLLSGLYGVAASVVLLPGVVSVGASASVFGLLGQFWAELLVNYVAVTGNLRGTAVGQLVSFTILSIICGLTPVVDNFMHMIGLATGFFFGLATQVRAVDPMKRERRATRSPGRPSIIPPTVNKKQKIMRGVGIAGSAVMALIFIVVAAQLSVETCAPRHACEGCRWFNCVPIDALWSCSVFELTLDEVMGLPAECLPPAPPPNATNSSL